MATSATQLLVRLSYPKVPGDQPWSMIDVTGPASYTPVTPGTPTTPVSGGQQIFAQDFGLTQLDFVCAMGSSDGIYFVTLIPVNGKPGVPPTTYASGNAFTSVILSWGELNPAEDVPPATNLSTSKVRLLAIGRY